jgi:hypothetical protein
MKDKKDVKHERSPSAEGSPLPDDAKTPIPVPSGSPPPPGSPSDVSSRRCYSSMFEQGGASGATPMSGPSSLVVDTSRDEEFTRKLFGDLNCDILGPPGDGKIIIVDDFDDDDEVQEEGTTDIDPRQFLLLPPMLLQGPVSLIVMLRGPSRRSMVAATVNVAPACLRLQGCTTLPLLCFCYSLCNL